MTTPAAVAPTGPAGMVETWSTFIPPGKSLQKNLLGGGTVKGGQQQQQKIPARLEDVKIETKDVNSLQDATFIAVNQANARLVKSTGQAEVASKLEACNKKQKKAPVQKKRPLSPIVIVQDEQEVVNIDADDSDAILAMFLNKKVKTEKTMPTVQLPNDRVEQVPLPLVMGPSLPIHSLEAHQRRDNQLQLFAMTIERPHRATNDTIINTPPAVGVLNYCSQYKDEMPWFNVMQQAIANSDGKLSFQKTPVFRRSVLVTFLREPDPKCAYERPCVNLDREPRAHEGKVRCIAHRMSEQIWGEGKGFRLREMLFSDVYTKINSTIDNNARIMSEKKKSEQLVDPRIHLSNIPELCYMCHVWMVTEACLDQKNKSDERSRKDMTVSIPIGGPGGKIMIMLMNRFMVDIDKAGEYDRRMMVCSDDVAMGTWGPFPLWNQSNYIPVKIGNLGLLGFEETPNLLFRLPRTQSHVTGFSSVSNSAQSNLTSAARAVSTFRQ